MNTVEEILEYNKSFVESGSCKVSGATKYPRKKLAVISCMDARLTLLLPAALGVGNGDIKLIKTAGGFIDNPYGSVMRSLMVCIYELGVEDVLVIGHYDCGMQGLNSGRMTAKMLEAGITEEAIEMVGKKIDLDKWLCGFESVGQSVLDSVSLIRSHPLVPKRVGVYGFVMDPVTGRLDKPE